MIEHITIERESEDRLTCWRWRFWYDAHALWLDYYGEFQRPTRRHGFTCTQSFAATGDRRRNSMEENDVLLPADIQQEAIKSFCEGIRVRRRSERKIPA